MRSPIQTTGLVSILVWSSFGGIAVAGEPARPGDSAQTVRLAGADAAGESTGPQSVTTTANSSAATTPTLEEVVVTGSLIPQRSTDSVSPVITLSSTEIEDQGFRDIYDALRSLPIASGAGIDSQATGGFTPAASAISLFGLDPSFTLTLLDGRPIADYPLPNNGVSDITDLANLPLGLIDHIDVLTGAASSIYGSSAIAGVVNIVLKDKVDGTSVSVRDGGYSIGDGRNQRVQLSSGFSRDKFDAIFGFEYTHQQELLQDRDPGLSQISHGQSVPRTFLSESRDPNTFQLLGYDDPGAATCANLGKLFGGTLAYENRPGFGNYCGSPATGYNSLINADNKLSGLLTLKYHITDNMTAYTELQYGHSAPTYSGGLPFWSTVLTPGTLGGFFFNQTTQNAQLYQREFSPEEVGGWNGENQHVYTHQFNGSAGLKGTIGDSGYGYDLYYHYSQENTHYVSSTGNFRNNLINDYYLGPQLGTTTTGISGFPIFAPNPARLYTALTPAQYFGLVGTRSEFSVATKNDITLNINNPKLFSLPAGDVGGGAVVQYGGDSVHAPPDPNALAGEFDGLTERPNSAGKRSFYATGGELRVPLLSKLTADVSGRYDHYDVQAGTGYGGNSSSGKFTYKLGLEFRPFQDLLVRAGYATAFRTPDLFYLFEGATSSFPSVTDWFQCRQAGYTSANITQCPLDGQANPRSVSSGSTTLKNITAKTLNYGFVWSTLENHLRWSVDYNRVDISNEVQTINTDTLLQTEADCRLGKSEAGQPFDINSPTCQNALALVQRQAPNGPLDAFSLTQINSIPINVALEHQAGIQTAARYSWGTDAFGNFSLSASYFRQLQHTVVEVAGDAPLNLLCCGNRNVEGNTEFPNITSADAVWNIGRFSTTLHGTRYGATFPAASGSRSISPWILVNASEKVELLSNVYLQLIVNNIANKQPPTDPTSGTYPYYDVTLYNAYGRAYWIELEAKLGGKK